MKEQNRIPSCAEIKHNNIAWRNFFATVGTVNIALAAITFVEGEKPAAATFLAAGIISLIGELTTLKRKA